MPQFPPATHGVYEGSFTQCIRPANLPFTREREYVRPYVSSLFSMLPSSSRSKRGALPSRSVTPSNAPSPPDDFPALSDVQCYTCRRRHVKCDRILPTCAKCRKKGVPCLGYQKPLRYRSLVSATNEGRSRAYKKLEQFYIRQTLSACNRTHADYLLPSRWADGVAVRGKLKGKSQPVVDSQAITMVRNDIQRRTSIALEDAAHLGLPVLHHLYNDVVADERQFWELIAYHNATICTKQTTVERTESINNRIAPLSQDHIQKLPRPIINCILGIAAVHMASRQPGSQTIERLALETKANVLQSYNRLIQKPQYQLAQDLDMLAVCGALIIAMELLEHGPSRFMIHVVGQLRIIASFGGVDHFFYAYPHLHTLLSHISLFETMWITMSHTAFTRPKQTSRDVLEMICSSSLAKRSDLNHCPIPLMLAVWDIGACAPRMLGGNPISFGEMHKREQILLAVLSFQPQGHLKAIQDEHWPEATRTDEGLQPYDYIGSAWKAATTILVLRFLYFGRQDLEQRLSGRSSTPTPSLAGQTASQPASYAEPVPWFEASADPPLDNHVEGFDDVDNVSDYLTAGMYIDDTLSRSPSPLPSPILHTAPPTSSIWESRYKIHDEAFVALFTSLTATYDVLDPVHLRYIALPVLILGLVSRPHSAERALCLSYLTKFEQASTASPSPISGEELVFDVAWEKLDAYSAMLDRERHGHGFLPNASMARSAPEWNWWDMTSHIDLNLAYSTLCGTSHMERGAEHWALKLMSLVVNDECFDGFSQESTPSHASSSST